MPDGANVTVTFDVAGRPETAIYIGVDKQVDVIDGKFEAILTPPRRSEFVKGPYQVTVLFTPKAQSATVLDIVGRNGERLSGERVTAVGSFNVLEISKTVDLSVTVVPVTYPFVNTTQYGQGTAERTVADFLVAWRDKDYRRMASLMSISSRSTGLADADFIESLYELKSLKGAEIVNVTPAGASTTEITVNVWYEVRTNIVQKKRIIMRTVKESTTGQAVPRTSSGGSWGIVPLSLREIEAP